MPNTENAGCDICGTLDRIPDRKTCANCCPSENAENYEHSLDLASVEQHDEDIFDVSCSLCGLSGSFQFPTVQVNW